MQTHKRKRSLNDSPVDISKMAQALKYLEVLKEELDGVEEVETEMESIMKHVKALEGILSSAKRPKINFSALKEDELTKLGIERKLLSFHPEKLDELERREGVEEVSSRLKHQLSEIYDMVNMDYEPGSRMVLDAVLLTLGRITRNADSGLEVAIFPEMKIPAKDGVLLEYKGYEALLTGSIDYTVIQYKNEMQNKERLLGVGGVRRERDIFTFSEGRLFLVEAKRMQGANGNSLGSHIPEAVGQAVALAIATKQDTVRFCLSNGQTWLFFILRQDKAGGKWVYYESAPRQLGQLSSQTTVAFDDVSKLLVLAAEWLCPSVDGLYELHE